MRRNVMLVVAWVLATLVSVVIAATAVGSVRDQVTDRPAPIITAAAALTTSSTAPTFPTTTAPAGVTSTTTFDTSTTDPSTTTTTVLSTTTTQPSTTTVPSSSTTLGFTVTSYDLVGGWVRIRYNGAVVLLDGANPKAGYRVDAENVGPEKVEIEFEGASHKSKFTARLVDGVIDVQISEDNDD